VSEGIKEVAWGGGKPPDKTCREFVIETCLAGSLKPNTTLYFSGRAGMRAGGEPMDRDSA
jgi:uncharacterized protein YcnI